MKTNTLWGQAFETRLNGRILGRSGIGPEWIPDYLCHGGWEGDFDRWSDNIRSEYSARCMRPGERPEPEEVEGDDWN